MSPIPHWCPTKSSHLINGHCTVLNRNKRNKSKTRLPNILAKRKESHVMSPCGKRLNRLDVLGGLFWKVTGKIRFPGYSRWSGKQMINWKKASKFRNTRGSNIANADSKSEKLSGTNFLRLESGYKSIDFLLHCACFYSSWGSTCSQLTLWIFSDWYEAILIFVIFLNYVIIFFFFFYSEYQWQAHIAKTLGRTPVVAPSSWGRPA